MSYKDLDIYKMAFELALEVHKMTFQLPKYEIYEQGSQVRRSSKSIKDLIVEGYGRRKYKKEFIKFLIYSHASCDEAISQLEMINQLYFQENPINPLIDKYNILGGKINRFITYVENKWNNFDQVSELPAEYITPKPNT